MHSSKFLTFVLVASLVAASGLVVKLSMQQRALVDRVSTLTTRVRDPYVGIYLPAVTLKSVAGDPGSQENRVEADLDCLSHVKL